MPGRQREDPGRASSAGFHDWPSRTLRSGRRESPRSSGSGLWRRGGSSDESTHALGGGPARLVAALKKADPGFPVHALGFTEQSEIRFAELEDQSEPLLVGEFP